MRETRYHRRGDSAGRGGRRPDKGMEYILETQNLTKVYGQKEAARDVNLHIREGQIYGLGLTPLIYLGINQGLNSLFGKGIDISEYMPDSVLSDNPLETVKSLAVALIWGAVFLIPAIRIFDRKDVK